MISSIKQELSSNKLLYGIVSVIALKMVLTGIFITPPWDIPDEYGHFSYVKDMATGKGFPVMHERMIDEDIWKLFSDRPKPNPNWIAQHPPAYYILNAPLYYLGSLFSESEWVSFYLIRSMSAVWGAGLLILIYKSLILGGARQTFALSITIITGTIPMVMFMSGGLNHDIFLSFTCSLAFWFWLKFHQDRSLKWMYSFTACLALSTMTKYTAVIIAVPLVISIPFLFKGRIQGKLKQFIIGGMITFSLLGLWSLRNLQLTGSLFPTVDFNLRTNQPILSWIDFYTTHNAFEHMYKNYIGLIGWQGHKEITSNSHIQITKAYRILFDYSFIVLSLLTVSGTFYSWFKQSKKHAYTFITLTLTLGLTLWISGFIYTHDTLITITLCIVFSMSAALMGPPVREWSNKAQSSTWVLQLTSFLLVFVIFVKVYSIYIDSNMLRATHGRYLFPLLIPMILGFLYPGFRVFPKLQKYVVFTIPLFVINEFSFWFEVGIKHFASR